MTAPPFLAERKIYSKSYRKRVFKHTLIKPWLFGGLIALVPTTVTFVYSLTDIINFWIFFNDVEILYVCVTLATILFIDIKKKKLFDGYLIMLFIILYSVLYGAKKTGGVPQILNPLHTNNLAVFNLVALVLAFLIGLIYYIMLSIEDVQE